MDDGHIIARLLEDTVAKYPDYPAVRWIVKKQIPEKLYRELNEDRNKIAGALLKKGFEGKTEEQPYLYPDCREPCVAL